MSFFRWSILLLLIPGLVFCMKISVEPPVLDFSPDPGALSPSAPLVQVRMIGKNIHRRDWPRARSMYRVFSSGVENKSGSLSDLTRPAMKAILNKQGYRVRFSASEKNQPGARLLTMNFRKASLIWQPPREFIQRPTARKRGTILLDFLITFRLHAISGSPSLEHECREKFHRRVRPGTQSEFMASIASGVLSACMQRLNERISASHQSRR